MVLISVKSSSFTDVVSFVTETVCFCHQSFLIKINLTGYLCLKEDP